MTGMEQALNKSLLTHIFSINSSETGQTQPEGREFHCQASPGPGVRSSKDHFSIYEAR